MRDRFDLILHRGCNFTEPENSLAGIGALTRIASGFRIEIDIAATADGVAVLCHDLTLSRLCGTDGLISDLRYRDLPVRLDGSKLVTLESVLDAFPKAPFLLDLRDDDHAALFCGGVVPANFNAEEHAALLFETLKPLFVRRPRPDLRLMAGSLDFGKRLVDAGCPFPVDVSERFCRPYLDGVLKSRDIAFLGPNPDCAYVRVYDLTEQLTGAFGECGIDVIATASFPYRSLQNTRDVIAHAQEKGAAGILVSPVSEEIVAAFRQPDGDRPT